MDKPIKCFHKFSSEQRAMNAANFRLGHVAKQRTGEHFWTHPSVPNVAFKTRKAAITAALAKAAS